MKLTTTTCQVVQSENGWTFSATIPNNQYHLLDKLKKVTDKEGPKTIEVKAKRKGRSLSANAYMWILCTELAKTINIPKGDMYIKMIKRFGKHTSVIIKAEAIQEFIKKWDAANTEVEHSESLCEVTNHYTKNYVKWLEINCHFGSSNYSSEEFNTLLNGIVSECELMGVETMKPHEIATMMKGYNNE